MSIFRVSNERGDLHAVALELDGVEPPSLDEVDGTVGTEPNLPQVLWNRFFSNILHLEDFTRVDPMGLCLFLCLELELVPGPGTDPGSPGLRRRAWGRTRGVGWKADEWKWLDFDHSGCFQ